MALDSVRHDFERRLDSARRYYAVDLLWRTYESFARNEGAVYAAAVSYYALFSLVPLLILIVAIFGIFLRNPDAQFRATVVIAEQLPTELNLYGQIDRTVVSVANANSGLVGFVALIGVTWTASLMFSALRKALNNAFGVVNPRSFIHGRVRDLLTVLAVSLLLIVSVGLTAALGVLRAVASNYFGGVLINLGWGLVYFLLPLATSFAVFLLTYRLVPNHTLRLDDLWLGALIAALGFELTKIGFSVYVTIFGQYQEVYGPLGGIIAFLLFVFLAANIVIFAAGLTAELANDRARATLTP